MTQPLRQTLVGCLALATVVTVVAAGLVAVPAAAGAVDAGANESVAVVVLFEDDDARGDAAVQAVGGQVTGGEGVDVAPVLFATVPEAALNELRSRPGVASVVRDRSMVQTAGPTPEASTVTAAAASSAESQAGSPPVASLVEMATLQESGWGYERIDAGDAAATVGSSAQSGVDVAVLDTGVDTDHPQLTGALAWGANTAGDGTTYGLSTAEDRDGHGTFVTGIVAAEADGTTPVGVSPDVDVYAVKVLNGDSGSLSDLVEGIDVAMKGPDGELGTADDADVVSMSLGSSEGTSALEQAVQDASDRAVVVAAAGNFGDGDPSTDEVTYPARYGGAIAVAATDRNDDTPTFSSEGPDVELSAPGVDVTSTLRGGGAGTGSGTSFAAPFVSGTAALVVAEDGSLSPGEVRDRLQTATVDIETDGRDRFSGYGLIQADAAVAGDAVESSVGVTLDAPANGAAVSGTVDVVAVVDDPDAGRPTVEVSVDGGPWQSMSYDSDDRYVYAWDTTSVENGDHDLRVRAREDGASATDTATVTVDNDEAPAVSVVEPTAGAVIEGTVEAVVSATDDETPPEELAVEVAFADGQWQTATYDPDRGFVAEIDADRSAGNYTLRARVTDGSGQQTETAQTVTVDGDDPPGVTIVEPTGNDSVAGQLAVAAAVTDDRTPPAEVTAEYRLGDGRWRSLEYDRARGLYVAERGLYTAADGNGTVSVRADDGTLNATTNRTVAVDNAGLDSENLTVTAGDTTVEPGGNVTVDVAVTGERPAGSLRTYVAGVPESWSVVDEGSAGAIWVESDALWYWSQGVDTDQTRNATVTLAVPPNASEGATLTVIAVTGDGEAEGQRAVVSVGSGDSVVDVIAGDDGIQATDVLSAIEYYNSGEQVPGTGQTLTATQVLEMIERYNTGR